MTITAAITYELDVPLLPQEVARLFEASGIHRPSADLPRIASMFAAPGLQVSAWDAGTLVGVARSLTDYAYCCYLSDLAVDRRYQGAGIGAELVRRTQEAVGEQVTLVLVSAPDAVPFYEKLGLERASTAFLHRRKR